MLENAGRGWVKFIYEHYRSSEAHHKHCEANRKKATKQKQTKINMEIN